MFTGLIETTGNIKGIIPQGGDKRLTISVPDGFMDDVAIGDSIAVSGVCLTALNLMPNSFDADVSNETLALTSLGNISTGSKVNLEKALLATSRLGGHIVSGHVDGLAMLSDSQSDGRSERLTFTVPKALSKYIAQKGSITIDGISLTVNTVADDNFSVNIVPHTAEKTTLSDIVIGQSVNIEVDLLARYLERLLSAPDDDATNPHANLDQNATMRALLSRQGYTD